MAEKTLRSVTSTANCAHPKDGRSWARTSMRLSSAAPTFMSLRKALKRTRAPASWQILATLRSTGLALLRILPDIVHEALWPPRASRGAWNPSHVASETGCGNCSLSNKRTRNR